MKYKCYRLKFSTAVHFGTKRLGESECTFSADRLFSAMCIEARKIYGENGIEKLIDITRSGKFLLSDAMPYIDKTYYIPKPILHIENSDNGISTEKKAFKKLKYIPASEISLYMSGNLKAEKELNKFNSLGKSGKKYMASIKENDNALPFSVGIYKFCEGCGLYIVIGYENDNDDEFAGNIFESLSYTGIGGKVSSGLGKFDISVEKMPDELLERLNGDYNKYMSLSVSMAKNEELEKAIDKSSYAIVKKSGFISSYDYLDTQVKRRDFYCFESGSCFVNKFDGDVFDLKGEGSHSVYKYAKPMFMGVK